MKRIEETDLPGVGARFDLTTDSGRSIGVVAHRTGRRDFVVYDTYDPDRAAESVELSADEGHTLGELLGGNPLLEQLDSAMQKVGDLVITWITVAPDSPVVGQSLSDMELRTRTGAGVAAIATDDGATSVPGGDQILEAGATAVVVGLPAAVEAARALLSPTHDG